MEIRKIKKSELGKVMEFNRKEYPAGHILQNETYYNWQFDNVFNPESDSYTSLGLFNDAGELVGTNGLFPAPITFLSKSLPCIWFANLIVREDLRSLGYGYLLMEKSVSMADMAVDHNINAAAWPLFIKSGWQGGDIERYLGIINPEGAERVIGQSNLGLKVLSSLPTNDSGLNFESVSKFDSEVDALWESVSQRYPISIERSSKYLNWRYAEHPMTKYHIFSANAGNEMKGFIVLRIDEITEGPERKPSGVKIGRIIDWVADSSAEEFILLQAIEWCRDQKVDFIDYFTTENFHAESLKKLGFVNDREEPYSLMPTLLNPIDRVKRTRHNFAFKISNPERLDSKAQDLGNWYAVKGCGDQDRPY
ncbi:MAG: hypothetical protein Q7S83_03555 [bacterium]|nr:hypothetical protein [bacterium]